MKNIYSIFIFLIIGCLGSMTAFAQCPAGQTEITIEIYPISFGGEIGWELVDQTAGTVIACQPAGTYATGPGPIVEGPFCVTDGNTIVMTGYDDFGDDWNGGFFNVIITEDGSVNGCAAQDGCTVIENGGEGVDVEPDVSVTNSCETSNEEFVVTLPVFGCDATPLMGCTVVGDPNYDPCATIDDGSCICDPTQQMGLTTGDSFCYTDAAVAITPVLPTTDPGIQAIQTVNGSFDGEHGIGLYAGTFDDGTVLGLPPAGTGLFGTDTEASIEGSTPGANNINTVGNWGATSAVGNSVSSAPLVDGATYTVFIVDDFGDGWDGSDVDLVDCDGNIILANLATFIDAIAGDAQDELAWTTFVYTAPAPTIVWSGTGAVTTDPDAVPNSGDEVYTFDPSLVVVTGCDATDVDLTMSITSCGNTCEEIVTVTVDPVCSNSATVECDGNLCTVGDVQVMAADGTECSCTPGAVDMASCDPACTTSATVECDGNICTVGDVQVMAADGSECSCTPGAIDMTSCDPACTTTVITECDGDPTTTGDVQILAADGSQCGCSAGGSTPIPSITCPSAVVNFCDGTYDCMFADNNPATDGNGVSDAPIIGGTAAFATDAAGIIDLTQLSPGGTYTITLNYEENGVLGTPVMCSFMVEIPNDADGGQF